ncbi:carbohydrate sulfotransferase 3-like [Glandiceps talaboti]
MNVSRGVPVIFVGVVTVVLVDIGLLHLYEANSRVCEGWRSELSEHGIERCLCLQPSAHNRNNTTQLTQLGNDTRNIPRSGVNVLIIAGERTGSSFVGDYFRSHPTIFYLFEPLYSFRDIANLPQMSVVGVDVLTKIYDCNFSGYSTQWDNYFKRLVPVTTSRAMKACAPLTTAQVVSRCCQRTQHRVAKVIRLLDVRDLIPLMESPTLNLKVINVVRDPRAMMSSLMAMYYSNWISNKTEANKVRDVGDLNEYLSGKLKLYCEQMLRNYLLFTANGSQAWKENFMIVRFEDIASHPRKYANIMYSHAGINMYKEVYKWIAVNTQSNMRTHDSFGTMRKSSAVVNDWRNRVTFELTEKIQKYTICREYMHKLHYSLALNTTILKNKNMPLLTPFI